MHVMEIWKPIENYEGYYEVSNLGRVKSCERAVSDKRTGTKKLREMLLSPTKDSLGYLRVSLYKNSEKVVHKVHRLVAQHFCERGDGDEIPNHLDNDKTNNHYTNLEWTTYKGNMEHKLVQGRGKNLKGEECSWSKLGEDDIREIKNLYSKGMYQKDIAEIYNIKQPQVSRICNNVRWKHLTNGKEECAACQ